MITLLDEKTKAPDFTGMDENRDQISLSQFKGKKLVLFFYPKDMTPGCSMEVRSLRDSFEELTERGIAVVGVSADSVKRHCRFIEKEKLPFHLIADEDKIVLSDYKVWGPKKFMGRTYDGIHRVTYIIDENGFIIHVIKKVKTKSHAQQILELIDDK